MAEEKKGMLDAAREMLGDKLGGAGELMDKAREMLGDKAEELLENADELKKKAVEIGQAIAPDSLDDKVEGVVDQAVDFLKEKLGKKEQ
ncbi:MAG: hypothetical protein IJT30_10810 [Muribaculaceae bacterium]|nr:hypothetical protein [Muribaculaceae bacterium]